MFGDLNEKQEEYTHDILSSGRHLLSLINDILDLSKIESGKTELDLDTFDLPTVIESAILLVREKASGNGILLSHEIDPELGVFTADQRKVKQVILNLLSNAVKFTDRGGKVSVKADPDGGSVRISVIRPCCSFCVNGISICSRSEAFFSCSRFRAPLIVNPSS